MNKVLIILGMHRSGTSLVANWLHECGLHLGDRLLGEHTGNEKGHFEDLDFLEVHEQAFRFNKVSFGGLQPPLDITLNDYFKNKIRFLVQFKNHMRPQWGWKEPRTCLFMDYYKDVIPSAKYLILYRDYSFVVDSVIRRALKNMDLRYKKRSLLSKVTQYRDHQRQSKALRNRKDAYLKGWIIYNEKLLKLMEEMPKDTYIFTDYETLLDHSPSIFESITAWGFELRRVDFKNVYDAKLMKTQHPELLFDKNLEAQAKALRSRLMQYKTA